MTESSSRQAGCVLPQPACPASSQWSEPAVSQGQRPERASRIALFDGSSYAVLLASLLAIVATFDDYGMSWDEPYSMLYGRKVLRYFLSLGADTSALQGSVSLRGGAFHALVEALAMLAPDHALFVRRLVTPLVGFFGLLGCWRLARLLGGARCGFLAVTFLALTPAYYGHMFINPADIPFAAGYVWALYYVVRFVRALPSPRWSVTLATGSLIGITACIRIGGVLLLAYVALLAVGVRLALPPATASIARARSSMRGLRSIAVLFAIAYVAMLALWPAALRKPLTLPLDAVFEVMRFPKHEPVLFAGLYYWSDALPWFYHLGYLLVQLPEVLLVFAAIGSCVASTSVRQGLGLREPSSWVPAGAVLLASFVPLAYTSLFHPVAYDGLRHMLFVVPPIACLAGLGADWALDRIKRHRSTYGLALCIVALSCCQNAWAMLRLHPYEYTYYNALVGGTRGAYASFELDYWTTSFREAIAGLESYLEREREAARESGRPASARHVYKLAVCGHYAVAASYLPPTLVLTQDIRQADFVLATTKHACQDTYTGEVVAEVQRMQAPFAVVKRLRRLESGEAQSYVAAAAAVGRPHQPGPWNTASMSWPSGSSTNAP